MTTRGLTRTSSRGNSFYNSGIMRLIIAVLIIAAFSFIAVSTGAVTFTVERGTDLQAVIDHAADGDTLLLGAREFTAVPRSYQDPLCGNCENPQTEVSASVGFRIIGKGLTILGKGRDSTVLITNAGYGIYLENANGTIIRDLAITGGKRDSNGSATDAAVVIRRSRVLIEQVDIRDNKNRSSDTSLVVGIGGVFGREGSEIIVRACHILNNGWDGIALYRGATATVSDCLIRNGRGVGIGVTWDATCLAYRNEVSGYWKGIGSFGNSILIARNNIVHDNLGWGVAAAGQSCLEAINNVIHRNGNCGIAPWSTDCRGRIINNIITGNGWRDQWICPCVGVWNYGDWAKWDFRNNIVWNNAEGDYRDIWEQSDINGNLSVDPLLSDDGRYEPGEDSPVWHAGAVQIFNVDGSTSHIGHRGGPQAIPR